MAHSHIPMATDPDYIKKIQERKARREALEKRYGGINDSKPKRSSSSRSPRSTSSSGGSRKGKGPVYRSTSMLTGQEVILDGEEAQKLADRTKYKGGS